MILTVPEIGKVELRKLNLPGYMDYYAGSDGNIYTFNPRGNSKLKPEHPVRLKSFRKNKGSKQLYVNLFRKLPEKGEIMAKHIPNRVKRFTVAQLIAEAFVGNNNYELAFRDGNTENTKPDNIYYKEKTIKIGETDVAVNRLIYEMQPDLMKEIEKNRDFKNYLFQKIKKEKLIKPDERRKFYKNQSPSENKERKDVI